MNSAHSLKPGEHFLFQCPDQGEHKITKGQLYPKSDPYVWIEPKNLHEAFIAPLRFGNLAIEIQCNPGEKQNFSIELEKPQSETQIPPDPPLGLIQPQIPTGFFVFWLGVILFASLLIYVLYRKYLAKKFFKQNDDGVFVDPLRDYKTWMRIISDLRNSDRDRRSVVLEISPGLRRYLEYKFLFSADWATTPEFMGTLKSALIGQQTDTSWLNVLERVLYQLDEIRFSKRNVENQEYQLLGEELSKLTQTIEKLHPNKVEDNP